jgi:hypothetical protein
MKKLAELLRGENYIREALSSTRPSPAFTVRHSHHIGGRYGIPGAYAGRILDPMPDIIPDLRRVPATVFGSTVYYRSV